MLRALFIALSLSSRLSADPVSFSKQIAPLLKDKCMECHREGKAKGGYRLDTFEQLSKAGDSKAVPLTPSKPEASDLYARIVTKDEDDRMPAKGDALEAEEIAIVKRWINEGARYDQTNPKAHLADLDAAPKTSITPAKYPKPLPITALSINADGKRIATSGYGEVLLWDSITLKLVGRIAGMPLRIMDLKWLGRGVYLAVAGGTPGRSGEAWLVNTETLKPMQRLVSSRDVCQCLAVSGDGHRLAVGGADNHIRAFATPEGKPLWDIEAHSDWVMALAFSPDGQTLASGSRDRTARLMDAAKGEIKATYTNHETAVLALSFATDGKHIVSGSSDGELRTWNMEGVSDKSTTSRPGHGAVLALQKSGERLLASLADLGVIEVDLKAKKVPRKFVGHTSQVDAMALIEVPTPLAEAPVNSLTPKPVAPVVISTLITGSHDGEVRLWNLKENRERAKFVAVP